MSERKYKRIHGKQVPEPNKWAESWCKTCLWSGTCQDKVLPPHRVIWCDVYKKTMMYGVTSTKGMMEADQDE